MIDDDDLKIYEKLRRTRNELVHELFEIVMSDRELFLEERFEQIKKLLSKIEVWIIKNIEIPSNPDFDSQDIKDVDISSGKVAILNLMKDLANGSSNYLDAWNKLEVNSGRPNPK